MKMTDAHKPEFKGQEESVSHVDDAMMCGMAHAWPGGPGHLC